MQTFDPNWTDPWTRRNADKWSRGLSVVRVDTYPDGATHSDAPTGRDFHDFDYYCPHCDTMVGWMGAGTHVHCPKCGSPPKEHEVENYDQTWHDGDVVCQKCQTRVRGYDAG